MYSVVFLILYCLSVNKISAILLNAASFWFSSDEAAIFAILFLGLPRLSNALSFLSQVFYSISK